MKSLRLTNKHVASLVVSVIGYDNTIQYEKNIHKSKKEKYSFMYKSSKKGMRCYNVICPDRKGKATVKSAKNDTRQWK